MGKELTPYQRQMAELAEKYASQEKIYGQYLTTRGGVFHYQDTELGQNLAVIVLDSVRENAFYKNDFDPEVMLPPVCYAIGRSADEMAPDEKLDDSDYFEPQSESCDVCPHNEWGSSDRGRGKACGNRRRLALIMAGQFEQPKKRGGEPDLLLFDELEDFEQGEIAMLKLPVTSVKGWSKFVNMLSQSYRLPPAGVIAHLSIEPDPQVQFRLKFDIIEPIEDESLMEVVLRRRKEAEALISAPYNEPTPDQMEAPKERSRRGISGLRKQGSRRRHQDEDGD